VKQETERIESRFLEPACGTGNFLTEIWSENCVSLKPGTARVNWSMSGTRFSAVSSIYGIDILKDNVLECRKRLFDIFDHKYTDIFKDAAKRRMSECHQIHP